MQRGNRQTNFCSAFYRLCFGRRIAKRTRSRFVCVTAEDQRSPRGRHFDLSLATGGEGKPAVCGWRKGASLDAAAEHVFQHHGPELADRRFCQGVGCGAQQRGGIDVKGDEVLALGLQVRYLVDEVVR